MTHELMKIVVRGLYNAVGLDSPYSNQEYGPNWSKQRQKALDRDNYTCQVCGVTADELPRSPHVHHIKPRGDYEGNFRQNHLDNLITLCPSCHGKYEGQFQDAAPDEFAARAQD